MKARLHAALLLSLFATQARADNPWSGLIDAWKGGGSSSASASASASSSIGSASASATSIAGGGSAYASSSASASGYGSHASASSHASSSGAGHASASASASASGSGSWASSHASAGSYYGGGHGGGTSIPPSERPICFANSCAQGQQCVPHAETRTYSCVDTGCHGSSCSSGASCVNGQCYWWSYPSSQPTPTPAPQCDSTDLAYHDETYLPSGSDLPGYPQYLDSTACAKACANRSDCYGATLHKASGICYLKGYQVNKGLYSSQDWASYVKAPASFTEYRDAYLAAGNDLSTFTASSAEVCQSACACNSSCSSYTYSQAYQTCYLKDRNANRQPYGGQGWVTGLKTAN